MWAVTVYYFSFERGYPLVVMFCTKIKLYFKSCKRLEIRD